MMYALRQRMHSSWLMAFLCAGIVAGVILASSVSPDYFYSWVWLFVAGILIVVSFGVRRRYLIVAVIVAGMLIGVWRGSGAQYDLQVYDKLVGHAVTINGKILEDPDTNERHESVLRLGQLSTREGGNLDGKLWVTLPREETFKRSDSITVRGELQPGFAAFSGAIYRADLVRHVRIDGGDIARDVRDAFSAKVQQSIPEPAVSLGLGFLTGQRRGLPPELLEALKIAGLTHVIVASGYNLTILVRFARRMFQNVSKYLATAVPAGLVVSFIAITGMSPSMSRAGLVTGLSLLAWYYGRRFHPAVLLLLVAATTVMIDPSYGWGDLGWLLSFAAFAGVMLVAPLLQAYLYNDSRPPMLQQIFLETFSAYLTTLPILVISFGAFSNVALLANMLVLPLIPFVMLGVFVVGVSAFASGVAADIVAIPVTWVLNYMVSVAVTLSQQTWAQTEIKASIWLAIGWCAAVVAAGLYIRHATKYRLRMSNIIE